MSIDSRQAVNASDGNHGRADAPLPAGSSVRCPINGRPPQRLVQRIPAALLRGMWRIGLQIDVDELFAGVPRVALWESESGLFFFDPPIQGDARFYVDFYRRVRMHDRLEAGIMQRTEYLSAARHVEPGMKVLDVGCGRGAFRRHLRHAEYVGLDQFAPKDADSAVVRDSLDAHARLRPCAYDVVAAFQVIEHTADPMSFVAELLRCLRPGGWLILSAPLHPSAMTAIPNFLLNAPPHHLTWWTPKALTELAAAHGLDDIAVNPLDPAPHEGVIHWMNALSPVHTRADRYFAHRWGWHLGLAWSFAAGRLCHRFRPIPRHAHSINLLAVARKPGSAARG